MIRKLTMLFGFGVAGIAFSLVMSIYTGVQIEKKNNEPTPLTLPTPAIGS